MTIVVQKFGGTSVESNEKNATSLQYNKRL